MDLATIKPIAAALAVLPMLGVGLGMGNLFSTLLSSIARNPDVKDELFSRSILGTVMIELIGLLCFVLALLILYA